MWVSVADNGNLFPVILNSWQTEKKCTSWCLQLTHTCLEMIDQIFFSVPYHFGLISMLWQHDNFIFNTSLYHVCTVVLIRKAAPVLIVPHLRPASQIGLYIASMVELQVELWAMKRSSHLPSRCMMGKEIWRKYTENGHNTSASLQK